MDSNGVKTWDKTYGGSDNDDLHWLQETSSGDIMAIGSSESSDGDVSGNNGGVDVWVLKLDASGNMKWEQNYGGGGDERGISAQATPDGGFFFHRQPFGFR